LFRGISRVVFLIAQRLNGLNEEQKEEDEIEKEEMRGLLSRNTI
jgi:hypothetical protein